MAETTLIPAEDTATTGRAPATANETPTPPGVDPVRRRDHAWLLVVAVTALPIVVAGVRGLLTDWTPNSDLAIEALAMREVGGRHTPLLGPYSRLGWRHPGPLLFWLGAPFARLLGSVGLLGLAATINVAGLVGALAAARRLGGTLLLLPVAAVVGVMLHTFGPARLVDPWNPHVTYLPLLCFLLCAAAAADGRGARWALPAAVASGSFVAQSHLGAAALVGAGALGAAAWWWMARPAGAQLPRPWPTAALTVALWSGPLIDQVAGRHNMSDVVGYFLSGDGTRPALGEALGAAAKELGPRPAWTGAVEADMLTRVAPAPAWTLLITAAVLLASWLTARRIGDRTAARLVAYAAWLGFASVAAMTRTTDGLLVYVVRWTWTASMLGAAAVAFLAGRALSSRRSPAAGARSPAGSAVAIAAGVVLAVATLSTTADATRAELRPDVPYSVATHSLSAAVRERVPAGHYALQWSDPELYAGVPQSMGIDLLQHGYDITFPRHYAEAVGDHRTGDVDGLPLLMVLGGDRRSEWSPPEGARLVASYHPVEKRYRARVRVLQARLQTILRTASQARPSGAAPFVLGSAERAALARDQTELDRIEGLGGSPYDVWLVPATAPPN